MATPIQSFRDLINAWPEPTIANFATDMALTNGHARQMRNRGSVPPDRWVDLIAAADARGISIDYQQLVGFAKRRARAPEAA